MGDKYNYNESAEEIFNYLSAQLRVDLKECASHEHIMKMIGKLWDTADAEARVHDLPE